MEGTDMAKGLEFLVSWIFLFGFSPLENYMAVPFHRVLRRNTASKQTM